MISQLCDWCDVVEGSELRLMRISRGRPLRGGIQVNFNEYQLECRVRLEADAMFAAHGNTKDLKHSNPPAPWRRNSKKIQCIACLYWYDRWEIRWIDGRLVCFMCWDESDSRQTRSPSGQMLLSTERLMRIYECAKCARDLLPQDVTWVDGRPLCTRCWGRSEELQMRRVATRTETQPRCCIDCETVTLLACATCEVPVCVTHSMAARVP